MSDESPYIVGMLNPELQTLSNRTTARSGPLDAEKLQEQVKELAVVVELLLMELDKHDG